MLLLDKPIGLSSNDALQKARRLFQAARAGHTGTLDPLASGLLPVCFGDATRFAGLMLDADKEYLAQVRLGVRTRTGDAEGEILDTRPVDVSLERLLGALAAHRGDIEQKTGDTDRRQRLLHLLVRGPHGRLRRAHRGRGRDRPMQTGLQTS